MGEFSFMCIVTLTLLINVISGASVPKDIKEVEEFISGEIEKPHATIKRSDVQFIPAVSNFEDSQPIEAVSEPSSKPDKISVTIFKEYKVQSPEGRTEYVSIQEEGGDPKGSLSPPPPAVQEFIQQQISNGEKSDFQIQKANDVSYQVEPVVSTTTSSPRIEEIKLIREIIPPFSAIPVPVNYKRKTMDGWIPLFGKSYIGPEKKTTVKQFKDYSKSHYTKGVYYSPAKEAIIGSASGVVEQIALPDGVGEIIQAQPQLELFTKEEVISPENRYRSQQASAETKVQNLVIKDSGSPIIKQQTAGITRDGSQKVVIHAQNVIIRNDQDEQSIPNISQIKAYGSTPQISALLRERFKMNQNQQSQSINGKQFPTGGLSLRSLAQAIRNGAFSIENDIIPPTASERPQELEISIPHKFKMRPSVQSGYSNVNTQGLKVQATSASINQPITNGNPPKISANAFQTGIRDYGDSVKYVLRDPVQIVQTQPAGGYQSGENGQSLNQLAQQLEDKLRRLVQQEVLMASMLQQQQIAASSAPPPQSQHQQYGPPSPQSQHQQYGPPPPQQHSVPQDSYGVPQGPVSAPQDSYGPPQSGPLDSYGVPHSQNDDGPSQEYGVPHQEAGEPYGPPSDHDEHHHVEYIHTDHLSAPAKPSKSKPYSLTLDFDSGFDRDPFAHLQVEGGDDHDHHHHEHHHHDHGHHHDDHGHHHDNHGHEGHAHHHEDGHEGPDIKEEVKEKLVTLGKNLFYSALDFSRKYNPITFIEHVKEFPPVRFEVHDVPKKGRGKGKGKGRKRGH